MKQEELTHKIIGCAMEVHKQLGNGFQEVVYQRALSIELNLNQIQHQREMEMPLQYKGFPIGTRRVDFFIENQIMLEIKAITQLEDVHLAQAMNYLEAYQMEIGLLINFGAKSLQFKRVHNNSLKKSRKFQKSRFRQMKKYDSYKDSGIEWIGELPSHWDKARLKFNSRIKTGYTPPMDNSENYSEDGMIWVKPDNLDFFKEIFDSKEKVSIQGVKEQNIITKGSVLLCCIGTIGKFGIAGLDLLTNQQICGVSFVESLTPSFGKYLIFSSEDELNKHSNGNVVRILNATSLGNVVYPIPPIEEQTTIANYLDQKTSQIDDLIAKKERLIQLLEEERTAIINQAVTKGLDPTVPMKDSGIEWLGEIPAHWEVKQVKHIANIQGRVGFKGYTVSDLVSEGEGPYTIGAKHINKENQLDLTNPEFISWEKYYESPEIMVKKGDLLLTQRGTLGKVVYINNEIGEATINPSMVLLNKLKVEAEYLYFFFNSFYFKSWIDFTNTATAVPMISQEQLGNFKLILPPAEERKSLLKVINSKLVGVNKLKETVTKEIELLKEYKTALISEVVTGKVDVRDYSKN
jgi:type I restriction enzyme S subunit